VYTIMQPCGHFRGRAAAANFQNADYNAAGRCLLKCSWARLFVWSCLARCVVCPSVVICNACIAAKPYVVGVRDRTIQNRNSSKNTFSKFRIPQSTPTTFTTGNVSDNCYLHIRT